jgi:hypothetical protein
VVPQQQQEREQQLSQFTKKHGKEGVGAGGEESILTFSMA